tara:strand:- start:1544 stop:2482 length:939 start_codon:yes stop_codon:yes gene_type:complete
MSNSVRLQKYIADCGVTSRRKAEELISQGKVKVNEKIVLEMGVKVNPAQDTVQVSGQYIDHAIVNKIYVLMNKPRGCVTTVSDPEGRKTVMDYCQIISERIYPVGRLDYLSEGVLLLTNDGDFAQEVIHPSKGIVKTYEVKVFGQVTENLIKKMKKGVEVDGVFLKPDIVRIVGFLQNKTWLEFKLSEGKNREIRKICEAFGLTVDKLKRVAIGGLTCDGVAPGKIRVLNKRQLLKAIFSKDGYRSSKKSIKAPRETFRRGKAAESEEFHHLRKESYYTTIETMKKTGTGVYKKQGNKKTVVKEPAISDQLS